MRQSIERHKKWLVPLILVLAAAIGTWSVWSYRSDNALGGAISGAFFTEDDGKTYFADDLMKPSPFDHGGKQAYRAYVFRCGRGTPYVAYVGKYAEAGAGIQIRRRGEASWVGFGSAEGKAIINAKCPDGGDPDAVQPGG